MKAIRTLLHDAPEAETAEEDIRSAAQSLLLAEDRAQVLTIPADPVLTSLIRSAQARCFKALFKLGKEGT